jgi:hypothetical protein
VDPGIPRVVTLQVIPLRGLILYLSVVAKEKSTVFLDGGFSGVQVR